MKQPHEAVQAEAASEKYGEDVRTPPRREGSGRFPAELQVTSVPPRAEGSSHSLEDCSLMQAASRLNVFGQTGVSPLDVLPENQTKEGAGSFGAADGSERLSSVELSEDM